MSDLFFRWVEILPTPLVNGVPSFIWAFLWLFIGPFFLVAWICRGLWFFFFPFPKD
jgi:hypothetical protein